MKKENLEDKARDLDLPSLIDMVFILMIFFVVILIRSGLESGPAKPSDWKELPKARVKQINLPREMLETLTFFVEKQENTGELVLYVLNPDSLATLNAPQLSLGEALLRVKRNGSGPAGNKHSALLTQRDLVNALIQNHIDAYRKKHFAYPETKSEIEIIADKDTPFWLVNEVFKQCQEVRDNNDKLIWPMISKVIFRVINLSADQGVE